MESLIHFIPSFHDGIKLIYGQIIYIRLSCVLKYFILKITRIIPSNDELIEATKSEDLTPITSIMKPDITPLNAKPRSSNIFLSDIIVPLYFLGALCG